MLYVCENCGAEKDMKDGHHGEDCFDCSAEGSIASVAVVIDGEAYSLPKIKEWVEANIGQTHFAKKCGYKSNSQTSRQLRGLRKCSPETKAGIKSEVPLGSGDFDYDGEFDSSMRKASKAKKVEIDESSFPKREAERIAQLTIAAAKEGSVEATFGFRRLKLWQRAFLCMTDSGFEAQDSLGGAYWLAHSWKLSEEGQEFAANLFHRVFGFMPEEPQNFIPNRDDQHPMEAVVEVIIDGGFHIFAFGETGEGKSFGMERQARRISPIEGEDGEGLIAVVSTHEAMSTEHIVASGAARGTENGATETYTEKRVVAVSAEKGFPLVIDEPTVARPGILMVLQRLLENGSYYMPETGLWIVAKPTWRLLLTDNTNGMGRDARYNTRKPLDEAFRDRFLFVKWGEAPAEMKDQWLDADAEEYRRELQDGGFVAHSTAKVPSEAGDCLRGLDDTEKSKDASDDTVSGMEGFL